MWMINLLNAFKKDDYYLGQISIMKLLSYFQKHQNDTKDGVIKYIDDDGKIYLIKCIKYYYQTPYECKDCRSVLRHHKIENNCFRCNRCHFIMFERYKLNKVFLKKNRKGANKNE